MGKTGNAFDFGLFKRLLKYTNPYRLTLYFVAFSAVALSAFGVLRPILLQLAIDKAIIPSNFSD